MIIANLHVKYHAVNKAFLVYPGDSYLRARAKDHY